MILQVIFSVLNCMNFSNHLNQDMTSELPGNKSWAALQQCELRYDKEMDWSEGMLEARFNVQQRTCVNVSPSTYYCYDEFNANTKARIKIEMGEKCQVSGVEIIPFESNNLQSWIVEQVFPSLEKKLEQSFATQVENAISYNSEFAKACGR